MYRDSFITAVFLIVCKQYGIIRQQCGLRRGGFAPALSGEEVITMEIFGEYFKLECGKGMSAYFHAHCSHFFQKLTDRSLFVRQTAKLWQVKTLIQKRLAAISGEINDPVQSIDTVPLPVCVITGAGRDRHFHREADFGYFPAKDMHYYGFKLGMRVSRAGMITNYDILQARPHDIQFLDTLMEDFEERAPADKRFIDEFRC